MLGPLRFFATIFTALAFIASVQGTPAAAQATPTRHLGERAGALLGRVPGPQGRWRAVASPDGLRIQAVARGGLVQFSRGTHELNEVIFGRRLGAGQARISAAAATTHVERDVARQRARRFAATHYDGFPALRLRDDGLVDHRSFLEYRFAWQGRRGRAWLPLKAEVGINALTGRVAYYWSQRSPSDVPVVPQISASAARDAARRTIGFVQSPVRVGRPVLSVVLKGRRPRLVWETRVSAVPDQELSIPQVFVVQTDALTGTSSIAAGTSVPPAPKQFPSLRKHRASPRPVASASVGPVYGSCYDAKYWDGLTSRYEASDCSTSLGRAGYTARIYHNTSALTAFLNYPDDAVFYFSGHSLNKYATPGSLSGPHSAIGLLFEEGGPSGDLDLLALDIEELPATGSYTVCNTYGVCHTQNGLKAYFWGTEPNTYRVNLAVLQACATASNATASSLAGALNYWGAGTSVGFVDDILDAVNVDNSHEYGNAWANKFWSDLGAGATYSTALIDAANSVGGQYGYGSWVQFHRAGAPTSLYPAQYVDNLHGLPLE